MCASDTFTPGHSGNAKNTWLLWPFCTFQLFDSGTHKIQRSTAHLMRPFPPKKLYDAHRMDLVFVRPPGVQARGFVMTPDSEWYCRVLLLFSASALTDTGSKSFDCALVSTLEPYATTKSGDYCNYCNCFCRL